MPDAIAVLAGGGAFSRARAADAIEKASRKRPDLFTPYFSRFLELAEATSEPSLLWHLAAILPRLSLTAGQASRVASLLGRLQRSGSTLVCVFALQGLVDLSGVHRRFRASASRAIRIAGESTHPSVRARSRKVSRKGYPAGLLESSLQRTGRTRG